MALRRSTGRRWSWPAICAATSPPPGRRPRSDAASCSPSPTSSTASCRRRSPSTAARRASSRCRSTIRRASVFAPEPLAATRIAARAAALDALELPDGTVPLRLAPPAPLLPRPPAVAPGALLLLGPLAGAPDDADAIGRRDPGGAGGGLRGAEAAALLARHAEWRPPAEGLAQGALAGVPVKMLATAERTLLLVPLPFAVELRERVA